MTTYPVVPATNTPLAPPATPYWVVSVFLNDSSGKPVDGGYEGAPTVQFCIVEGGLSAVPVPNAQGSGLGQPMNTACLEALKGWATTMDWNTGFDWSKAQAGDAPATGPVSFSSVNITQVNNITLCGTGSDITPA